jgi:hypothetical protein
MIGVKGHVSLIVPHFAQRNTFTMRGVGMFEYHGNHEWSECSDATVRLTII